MINNKKQRLTLKEKIDGLNAIGLYTLGQLDEMEKEPDKYNWSLVKNRRRKNAEKLDYQ